MGDCFKVCPMCGHVLYNPSDDWINNTCKYCNVELEDTGVEKYDETGRSPDSRYDNLEHEYLREHIFPDPEKRAAYKNRREIEELGLELLDKELKEMFAKHPAKNTAKCPTCGSSSVSKIGGIERGASVLTLGIFSKKINKSFKCRSCGHTW